MENKENNINNIDLPVLIESALVAPNLKTDSGLKIVGKNLNLYDKVCAVINMFPVGGAVACALQSLRDTVRDSIAEYKTAESLRKFLVFFYELNNGLSPDERKKFAEELAEKAEDSSGNVMASIIDRLDNINKQKILANLVIAKGTGQISIEEFFRLSFILERIPYVDLKNLSLYQTEYYDENGGTELLYSTGALRTSMLNQSGDKYVLSLLGVKLLKFGVKCDGIKIPEIQGTQTIAHGDVLDEDDIDEILKMKYQEIKTEESREEYEKSGQAMFDYDAYRGK